MSAHPFQPLLVLACCFATAACGSSTSASTGATSTDATSTGAGSTDAGSSDTAGGSSDTAPSAADGAVTSDTASATTDATIPDATMADATVADSVAADAATASDAAADAAATDATSADAGQPGGAVPAAELQDKLLEALCQRYVNCPTKPDELQFGSVAGCKAFLGSNLTEFKELVGLVQAGTLGYDAKQAALCLAQLNDCEQQFDEGVAPQCETVFLGKTVNGGSCDRDEVCQSGYCKGEVDGCPGTCQAKASVGSSCAESAACQVGLGCVGGQCKALFAVDVGGPCVKSLECKAGLWCSAGAAGGTCTAKGEAGAPCQDPGSCKPGFSCAFSGPDKPPACQANLKAGQPCAVFAQPGKAKCGAGLVCVGNGGVDGTCVQAAGLGGACQSTSACGGLDLVCKQGKCAVLPTVGEPCKPANPMAGEFLTCIPPATCNDKLVCAPLPTAGQPCAQPQSACAENAVCDFATQTCKALPGAGEPCQGQCQKGLVCDPDVCKPPVCAN